MERSTKEVKEPASESDNSFAKLKADSEIYESGYKAGYYDARNQFMFYVIGFGIGAILAFRLAQESKVA